MRFSTFFKTICIAVSLLLPSVAQADDELKYIEINTLGYTLNSVTHEASFDWVATGFNQNQALVIPSTISAYGENYTVTAIGSRIFSNYKQVPSITLPATLKTIGDYAFSNCGAITSLTIPEGVTYIGKRAFNNCASVTSLTIPASVETLREEACFHMYALRTFELLSTCNVPGTLFCNDSESVNNVTTLILSGNIETIPVNFMKGASKLENVQLGENVKVIKNSAFESCTSLKSIVLPPNLTNIELYAFYQCDQLSGKITVPASCVEIGEAAFKGCFSLEEVEFNGIQKIGQNAFEGDHSLKKVIINEGTEQINVSAFAGCSGITELRLPQSLKTLQSNAFQYCTNITSTDFILPANLSILGSGCFQGCDKIEKVTIPAACTTMGGTAFKDCKGLKSAEILASKGKIGAGTFQNCTALEYVHIGGGVTGINNNPFQGCTSLKTVDITAPLTTIGINCFSGCSSIEQVSLPETLQSLNTSAFQGTSVHEYNLPGSVTSVARMSMDSNPSAIRTYIYGVPAAPSDIVQNYEDCWLYVVSGYEADYAAHPIWSKFAKVGRLPQPTSVVAPEGVTMKVNETRQIVCELVPADTYARLFYHPEDESIVTADANGLITGVHFGRTTVKITNVDGVELGSVVVTVTDKYDAPVFKLLTWTETSYKNANGGTANSNKVGSANADNAYNFQVTNWQEMTQAEIDAFHTAFQAFKNDKSDQFYNVPDGKFVYTYTLTDLPKGTYLTIDGQANDSKHWGVPSTIKNTQYATDGASYFELWDGDSGYPIIYNYVDGKDVTVEFYTLTFPHEKAGQYITGPNQPHDVTLHVLDIVPGEQYPVPAYKLLVWDQANYQSTNGSTNSNDGSHTDANSSHDFVVSDWQPMTAEEIAQFKSDYYTFKGDWYANQYYNIPDGKFIYTCTYKNMSKGTHLTIDGRMNPTDQKHWGVPKDYNFSKASVPSSSEARATNTAHYATHGTSYVEMWDGASALPIIYNDEDGKDVTIEFSTLTFPKTLSNGGTGEPMQPRYVSLAAVKPIVSGIEIISTDCDSEKQCLDGAAIYTLDGRYVGSDATLLPPGIYLQVTPSATRKLVIR